MHQAHYNTAEQDHLPNPIFERDRIDIAATASSAAGTAPGWLSLAPGQ